MPRVPSRRSPGSLLSPVPPASFVNSCLCLVRLSRARYRSPEVKPAQLIPGGQLPPVPPCLPLQNISELLKLSHPRALLRAPSSSLPHCLQSTAVLLPNPQPQAPVQQQPCSSPSSLALPHSPHPNSTSTPRAFLPIPNPLLLLHSFTPLPILHAPAPRSSSAAPPLSRAPS